MSDATIAGRRLARHLARSERDVAGRWPVSGRGSPEAADKAVTDALAHRGRDADGACGDLHARIALGHRRLSIIDCRHSVAQPMLSVSGRDVVVFNGEADDYPTVRAELSHASGAFRGQSDTEALLASSTASASSKACLASPACSPWPSRTAPNGRCG